MASEAGVLAAAGNRSLWSRRLLAGAAGGAGTVGARCGAACSCGGAGMVSGGSRVPVGRDGLRQLTWHVHDVIRRAQDGGRLLGGWGYRGARVSYEVLASRVVILARAEVPALLPAIYIT